jgi:hypothetical protein
LPSRAGIVKRIAGGELAVSWRVWAGADAAPPGRRRDHTEGPREARLRRGPWANHRGETRYEEHAGVDVAAFH